jgi:tetratricopeptide (TPR) repeat protein
MAVAAGVPAGQSALRTVPVGLPADAEIRSLEDLRPYAVGALGSAGAAALFAVLESGESLANDLAEASGGFPEYPYRYTAMEVLLDGVTDAGPVSAWSVLGAALTVLVAQAEFDGEVDAEDNTGPAAFAILDRARADGDCAPQLNLLLLLAGEPSIPTDVLEAERRRTEVACPDDPTPTWVIGQAQLRRFTEGPLPEESGTPTGAAVTTMRGLIDRHPTDVAALTGLGDAYLSAAMSLDGAPPFTARRYFRQALDAYNRAARHGGQEEATGGLARAFLGLGEPDRAIELLSTRAGSATTPGPVLEVLMAAQEAAGRFDDAERTARRLMDLGAAAYPRGPGLIPVPQRSWFNTLQDVSPALSLGIDHLQPLRSQLWPAGGAGGFADDRSFIPRFRPVDGLTGTAAACASWAWRRNAVLAGHVRDALLEWSDPIVSARPDGFGCDVPHVTPTRLLRVASLVIRFDTRGEVVLDTVEEETADDWQNLLRWAGDLPAAHRFVSRWEAVQGERSALPVFRKAEIDFLSHRYDDASAGFMVAARRSRLVNYQDDLTVARAELNRAASLIEAGRPAEAEDILRRLGPYGVAGYAFNASPEGEGGTGSWALLSYHASAQLADEERRTGRWRSAAENYETALSWSLGSGEGLRPEVLRNNAALAYLGLDDTARATELVDQALREDPHNPITLMTAGFIADRRGDIAAAVRLNQRALVNDPGLYPAANDLGVQLARLDRINDARDAFRQAVGARPDYALGWFNLGVLESSRGPLRVLAAQHALGTAYRLDPDLRDRRLELTIDAQVYRTALDLSKPLPPAWTFADLRRPAPAAAVGLLAAVGLALGLARTANRGAADSAGQWLEPVSRRLEALPLTGKARAPVWAIAATLLTFLLADLHHGTAATATLLYPLGLLVLVVLAMAARHVVGLRSGAALEQRSWGPGMVIGVAAGAVGFPWAPLPVVARHRAEPEHDGEVATPPVTVAARDDTRLHLAAPLALAAAALVLFLESALMRTPLSEAWAVAALIMCASLLLPVGPLDGSHLGKAGVAVSAGVIGTALLFGLGLI